MTTTGIPDHRKLEIIRDKLIELTGPRWTLTDDLVIESDGSPAVRLGAPHTGHPNHLDIEFLLSRAHPAQTTLADCATGWASDPEEAIRQAVEQWAETTAQVAFEVMEGKGERAGHFPGRAPHGVPGWHAVCAAAVGWGVDDASVGAKQTWLGALPWIRIGAEIAPALDRELNTLRMFIGGNAESDLAEVRVNGEIHEGLSNVLLGMDWPRSERMTTARTYVLLFPEAEPDHDHGDDHHHNH